MLKIPGHGKDVCWPVSTEFPGHCTITWMPEKLQNKGYGWPQHHCNLRGQPHEQSILEEVGFSLQAATKNLLSQAAAQLQYVY